MRGEVAMAQKSFTKMCVIVHTVVWETMVVENFGEFGELNFHLLCQGLPSKILYITKSREKRLHVILNPCL